MKLVLFFFPALLLSLFSFSQVQVNGSYYNVSQPAGAGVSRGDVLEIRAVISVTSGTTITNLSYTDAVPAGTSYVSGSLKALTNEAVVVSGVTNTGTYTDAADGDKASIAGSAITFYVGTGATSSAGGTIIGGSTTPVFYNVATIIMVAYRVTVTGALNSSIVLAGTFHYTLSSTATNTALATNTLIISQGYTCSSSAALNYLTAETNGTFGSGTTQNRSASSNVTGYTYVALTTTVWPSDGQYSILKNTSATQYTGSTPATSDKVFGVWDIVGDHTGTSTGAGNPPAANGVSGGYLLAVNATYAPAVVFSNTLTGLTPSAIYTLSFWVRNICPTCGNDPATGSANPADQGVKPNIAINLNARNYYSSGDISYTGQWVQKSFTFQNGASTVAVMEIRNNAPGGGGNDWVMDDISMTQCLIVLPVGLQSFTADPETGETVLSWQVASGTPQYFGIERSTDGISFFPIGQKEAEPNDNNDGVYHFTDDNLPSSSGQLFYRLGIVNRDGESTYSNIITVNKGDTPATVITRMAPNPTRAGTNANLYLWSNAPGNVVISLFDPAGALLLSRNSLVSKGENVLTFTLPDQLPRGIYVVRTLAAGKNSFAKLIVE